MNKEINQNNVDINEVKYYTRAEIEKHNKIEDLWVIINNTVYDLTNFTKDHPGGDYILLNISGKDATYRFKATDHTQQAIDMMKNYEIGKVAIEDKLPEMIINSRNQTRNILQGLFYMTSFVLIAILSRYLTKN